MIPIRIVSRKPPRQEAVEIPMGICSSLKMRFCCAGSPCGTDVGQQSSRGSAGVPPDWVHWGRRSSNSSSRSSARAHQREHVRFDAAVGRRVLDHLGMEVRRRCGAVHLPTRDGPRPGADRRDVRSVALDMERRSRRSLGRQPSARAGLDSSGSQSTMFAVRP